MSIQRSDSPTTVLWQGRKHEWQKRATMINMGLHVFSTDWQPSIKGRILSPSFKECTLRVFGKDDMIRFPVQICTKVQDVRQALSTQLMVDADSLSFVQKQGFAFRKQLDSEEIGTNVTVKGIDSFKPQPNKWPHPTAVIGCGYHGLKTGMMYMNAGNSNIVMFDRLPSIGGYCWNIAANKTSKLQTEFGCFHVWWGQDMVKENCGYPVNWGTWPKKPEILRHFQYAAETYGVLPHIRFQCNVAKLKVEGRKDDHNHFYTLTTVPVSGVSTDGQGNLDQPGETQEEIPVSVIYNYPGSMTRNRIIEYPGEDIFGGYIGYGMNDGAGYEQIAGNTVAVLGNGAFAVENVRTCTEYGCEKVYLVTRRKNLASPRMPCWFVHQGPLPTPGRLVLKMFEPMYDLAGFGDPWKYWSVHASTDKMKVNIIQNSRFGIGDHVFLAVIYGKCEYVEDTLKRCTKHTLRMSGGRKLLNVTVLNKSLGLLGDYAVDRLHGMQKMVGSFCDGDWRRVLMIDATGMNAANFTTFSTGIGTTGFVRTNKYLHDFPREYNRMHGQGLIQQLPRHKAEDALEKPAYVTDVKFAMTGGIIIESMCPKISALKMGFSEYKYYMYHYCHSTDRTLEVTIGEWNTYQEKWKAQGRVHDYVPYPYTKEMIANWFKEWTALMKWPISVDGPPMS